MDEMLIDNIRNRLERYGIAIRETRDHATELTSFGRYRAGAPYFAKYPLHGMLDFAVNDDPSLTLLNREYERITRELKHLEEVGGRAYREELYRDLIAYTEAYRTLLCFQDLCVYETGSVQLPTLRDEIGILILELRRDFSLTGIEREIAYLDETRETISVAVSEPQKEQTAEKPGSVCPDYSGSYRQKGPVGSR